MQFKEIVGQEATKQRLLNTVSENRVSHAQLFLGPEGSGSLALAVAYAQYLSCEDKQPGDSCGACSSCRKYQKLMHPDLHFSYPFFAKHKDDTALTFIEQWRGALTANPYLSLDIWRGYLDAENKQANINIAECHQIIKKLSFKPFESEYKILILWLPEYLDKEGNALLKIIEEPQPNTLFLLVAQNQDQILNTILSRTQLVKIPALEYDEIKEHLISAHHQTEEAAAEIAYLSNGNMTEALAMLQQDNKSYHELFVQWLRYCFGNKGIEVMAFVEQFAKMGRENQKNFLRYGTSFIRECCLLIAGAGSLVHLPAKELDTAQKMSGVLSIGKSQMIIDELEKAHYHVERNANPKILFLDVSLQIIKILINKNVPAGNQYMPS
ncbi:ATP-binding protein [Mucilaginibacter sp. P25]|uniref:DNA polymerase-3 subunit delta n=1 Tax=Mucilaginibacter gossypii TaxID=551996 RepID=A0A1G8KB90_9SPHI|nr:DNA polymerase III subunit delta' [Mucilaginibacter gossypii]SDI40120.1 DNA polymerase-3 subunit delta' [Mucilaginibacter gossypii]